MLQDDDETVDSGGPKNPAFEMSEYWSDTDERVHGLESLTHKLKHSAWDAKAKQEQSGVQTDQRLPETRESKMVKNESKLLFKFTVKGLLDNLINFLSLGVIPIQIYPE